MKNILLFIALTLCLCSQNMTAEVITGTCFGSKVTWSLNTESGVLTISGVGAAEYCSWKDYRSQIKTAVIKEGVTSIGIYAFDECRILTGVTIPNSVTSIGSGAFNGCRSLTSVTIPDGVTGIGSRAFLNCSSLKSVTLGKSVTSIEVAAFYGCRGLTSITIPNSVTSIGSSAFDECRNLTSVTIGNGVTSIEKYAFSNCSSLMEVHSKNPTPPYAGYDVHGDPFRKVTKAICKLYVPKGAKAAYQAAEGWREFSNILEE